jgi:alpha-D-ribose 1-methylphosphonate 5-triphosphate synthase subunit PhnL
VSVLINVYESSAAGGRKGVGKHRAIRLHCNYISNDRSCCFQHERGRVDDLLIENEGWQILHLKFGNSLRQRGWNYIPDDGAECFHSVVDS